MNKKDTLCFSGGGFRGFKYIGCIKALQEKDLLKQFTVFAGTSVGAFFALLCCIGTSWEEMKLVSEETDFSSLQDISLENMIEGFGLDSGELVNKFIKTLIAKKGLSPNITLKSLFDLTKKKIICTVTVLNNRTAKFLDYTTHPDLPVYKAVKMSMTLPIVFAAEVLLGETIVDGGLTCNFPIHIFEPEKVLGLYLVCIPRPIITEFTFENYVINNLFCLVDQIDKQELIKAKTKYDVICLDGSCVSTVEFNINNEKIHKLIQTGYDEILEQLEQYSSLELV